MSAELPLPTDTALVRIESRQYRLFSVDLGEGIPRVALKVGAWSFPPWFLVCWLLGVPILSGLLVWLAPPVFVTWAAMSRDDGGRLRAVGWVDWLGWAFRRQAPIVNAGTATSVAPRPITVSLAFYVDDDVVAPQENTREQAA